MDVVKFTKPRTEGDLIAMELEPNYCRDEVTYLAGSGSIRAIAQFAVLGAILTGTPTVSAAAAVSPNGGTPGNGAVGSLTADAGAMEGVYQVLIIEPAANGGTFEVQRPDGTVDGAGVIGTAYNGMINFTLADGANDFVSGDRIAITVDYPLTGARKFAAIDFSAANGLQNAAGIAPKAYSVPDGSDLTGVALRRGPMLVRAEELAWPAGATADQKAGATAQLASLGIVVRTSG
ncbi:head decoration protein [Caulobacter sp. BP25]|uniref:head decoration protein n=1 Tax=Caulobacter sp. BP25 TaxID=2048900 RepID=UPI000C12B9B9|nr:head decoration protein [Caulobacter sp. BP25]PHY20924.1 hypothetical protein CSW59_06855 [Caulobacter sp. BP25]